jgi:chromosomal replication initiator protein
MTSDRLPRAIPDLEERLSSRFSGGMIADVSLPNFETRLAILQAKSREKNFDSPENALDYIANRIKTNIRDLEGALNRFIAFCELQQLQPTEQTAASVLDTIMGSDQTSPHPDHVLETICAYFGIRLEDLMSNKRNRELVYPRQITMYLLRSELSLSYPTIGKILGGKDHTTIIHGFETVNGQLSRNDQLKNDVSILKEKISAVG